MQTESKIPTPLLEPQSLQGIFQEVEGSLVVKTKVLVESKMNLVQYFGQKAQK